MELKKRFVCPIADEEVHKKILDFASVKRQAVFYIKIKEGINDVEEKRKGRNAGENKEN